MHVEFVVHFNITVYHNSNVKQPWLHVGWDEGSLTSLILDIIVKYNFFS